MTAVTLFLCVVFLSLLTTSLFLSPAEGQGNPECDLATGQDGCNGDADTEETLEGDALIPSAVDVVARSSVRSRVPRAMSQ